MLIGKREQYYCNCTKEREDRSHFKFQSKVGLFFKGRGINNTEAVLMSFRGVAKQHSPLSVAQAMLGRGPRRNKIHMPSIETYFCSLKKNKNKQKPKSVSLTFFSPPFSLFFLSHESLSAQNVVMAAIWEHVFGAHCDSYNKVGPTHRHTCDTGSVTTDITVSLNSIFVF